MADLKKNIDWKTDVVLFLWVSTTPQRRQKVISRSRQGKPEISQQSYFVHHNFSSNCCESSRFQNHSNYFNVFYFKNDVKFFFSEGYIMKLHKSL